MNVEKIKDFPEPSLTVHDLGQLLVDLDEKLHLARERRDDQEVSEFATAISEVNCLMDKAVSGASGQY